MSLQMNLIFGALIFEMALMSILVMPLPHKLQEMYVNLVYKLYQNQNIRIGLGFSGCIIFMMFIDAFKAAVPRIPKEFLQGNGNGNGPMGGLQPPPQFGSVWEMRVKKFYAQRNMYITGAVMFLAIAILFNIKLLTSMVKNKKKLIELKKSSSTTTDDDSLKTNGVSSIEYEKLKQELKKKEIDVEALKKQVIGLHDAYQKKADEKIDPTSITNTGKKSE